LIDLVDYAWNQAVITYDLGRQLELLRSAGGSMRTVRAELPAGQTLALLAAGLVTAVVAVLLVRHLRTPAEQRLIRRYLRLVRRRYGRDEVTPATGLTALAERLDDPHCREFARIFGGAIYRDRRLTSVERRRLEELLRGLRAG
jgi:hypothetical protein